MSHDTTLVDSLAELTLSGGTPRAERLPDTAGYVFRSTPSIIQLRDLFAAAAPALLDLTEPAATCPERHDLSIRGSGGDATRQEWEKTLTGLTSLRNRACTLARAIEKFNNTVERRVLDYIKALGIGEEALVGKLLSHFDSKLSSIVKGVLEKSTDTDHDGSSGVIREVLEKCYSQSLDPKGTLHVDSYIIEQNEASLAWPFDPDFESEEYYQHQDLLDLDEGYARSFRLRCEEKAMREEEEKRRKCEIWMRFWVGALSKCPDGPTLFYPPASINSLSQPCDTGDVPRYLFRVYDKASSGQSDETVISSEESISADNLAHSKVDIFSRGKKEAAMMLHGHLNKPCLGRGDENDNLMSWSSSLLFLIQYAIWRCHKRGGLDAWQHEVKICAVDTSLFPRGQFVRDMNLIRAYHQSSASHQDIRPDFHLRLNYPEYDNGEYLSQGKLYHAGRSCVFSLGKLIQAGLHDLYPEFADPKSTHLWTNRVKDLRFQWFGSREYPTTRAEMKTALRIAQECFKDFNAPTEMALLLLSFKNRKLRGIDPRSTTEAGGFTFPDRGPRQVNSNNARYGPYEVQRFMDIVQAMTANRREDSRDSLPRLQLPFDVLANVFKCSLGSRV